MISLPAPPAARWPLNALEAPLRRLSIILQRGSRSKRFSRMHVRATSLITFRLLSSWNACSSHGDARGALHRDPRRGAHRGAIPLEVLAEQHARVDAAIIAAFGDPLILGGAPLAGLAAKVRDRVPVPLVEQAAAAVKQAECLVSLQVRKPTTGTFRRPDSKQTSGLSAALSRRIEHQDEPEDRSTAGDTGG